MPATRTKETKKQSDDVSPSHKKRALRAKADAHALNNDAALPAVGWARRVIPHFYVRKPGPHFFERTID